MDPSDLPSPSRPTWAASRPSRPAAGPPGLAALIDAERSALREHHDRLRALAEARVQAAERAADVDAAAQRSRKTQHGVPGMRDRLRTTEHDLRLMMADFRKAASAAASAADAAAIRVQVSGQRLDEVRAFVDERAGGETSLLSSIRRAATLPSTTRTFPSISAFIADDPARAQGDRRIEDLIGRPLGDRWALEDPEQPWLGSRWRAAWSCDGPAPLGEVYAVELVLRAHPVRRVHLFGTADALPGPAHVIESTLPRQGERNSLAALAAAVASLD